VNSLRSSTFRSHVSSVKNVLNSQVPWKEAADCGGAEESPPLAFLSEPPPPQPLSTNRTVMIKRLVINSPMRSVTASNAWDTVRNRRTLNQL